MCKLNSIIAVVALFLLSPLLSTAQESVNPVSAQELARQLSSKTAPLILDVRTEDEFTEAHIPGAINIPHDQLAERIGEINIDKDQAIVVHCRSGRRADLAAIVLNENGFTQILTLQGHFLQWQADGLPVESP